MAKAKKQFTSKILFLIVIFLLTVFAVAIFTFKVRPSGPKSTPQSSTEIISQVVFSCDDQKSIEATFIPNQVKLKLSDGRQMEIPSVTSASGARYANQDESFVFWNKGLTAFIQEGEQTSFANCVAFQTPTASATNTVSIKGTLVCLPHKNQTGPQTMECAYGLKADNGTYYGLKDSDPMYKNLSGVGTNSKVEVTGTITLQPDRTYDTIGTIQITSMKPI